MRVLVACEFTGRVRDAFIEHGHDAWSCDLEPTEFVGPHIRRDVATVLDDGWDLMVAFPPCTHLARSARRVDHYRRQQALAFVRLLMSAPIPRIAIENPVGAISTHIRRPAQIIQPWMFGHGETKATCLWLLNLPPLEPTNVVEGREQRISRVTARMRGRTRSRTYPGVAGAMGDQWGDETKLSFTPVLPARWLTAYKGIDVGAIDA